MSSSGPIVIVSSWAWGPTTCSNAARKPVASWPWVTRNIPIINYPSVDRLVLRRHQAGGGLFCRPFLCTAAKCSSEIPNRVGLSAVKARHSLLDREHLIANAQVGIKRQTRQRDLTNNKTVILIGHSRPLTPALPPPRSQSPRATRPPPPGWGGSVIRPADRRSMTPAILAAPRAIRRP